MKLDKSLLSSQQSTAHCSLLEYLRHPCQTLIQSQTPNHFQTFSEVSSLSLYQNPSKQTHQVLKYAQKHYLVLKY